MTITLLAAISLAVTNAPAAFSTAVEQTFPAPALAEERAGLDFKLDLPAVGTWAIELAVGCDASSGPCAHPRVGSGRCLGKCWRQGRPRFVRPENQMTSGGPAFLTHTSARSPDLWYNMGFLRRGAAGRGKE